MLLLFLHFGEENKAASLKPAKLYNLFTELESYQVNYLKKSTCWIKADIRSSLLDD